MNLIERTFYCESFKRAFGFRVAQNNLFTEIIFGLLTSNVCECPAFRPNHFYHSLDRDRKDFWQKLDERFRFESFESRTIQMLSAIIDRLKRMAVAFN